MTPARLMAKPEDRCELLSQAGLSPACPKSELRSCAGAFREAHFDKGEMLFCTGDPGGHLYLIAEGRVRLATSTDEGRELSFRHATAGDCSARSPRSMAGRGPPRRRRCTPVVAYALEPARAARAGGEPAGDLARLIEFLCRRVRDTSGQLEAIALHPLHVRLARFLLFALGANTGKPRPASTMPLEHWASPRASSRSCWAPPAPRSTKPSARSKAPAPSAAPSTASSAIPPSSPKSPGRTMPRRTSAEALAAARGRRRARRLPRGFRADAGSPGARRCARARSISCSRLIRRGARSRLSHPGSRRGGRYRPPLARDARPVAWPRTTMARLSRRSRRRSPAPSPSNPVRGAGQPLARRARRVSWARSPTVPMSCHGRSVAGRRPAPRRRDESSPWCSASCSIPRTPRSVAAVPVLVRGAVPSIRTWSAAAPSVRWRRWRKPRPDLARSRCRATPTASCAARRCSCGSATSCAPGSRWRPCASRGGTAYLVRSQPDWCRAGTSQLPLAREACCGRAGRSSRRTPRARSARLTSSPARQLRRLAGAFVLVGSSAPETGGLRQTATDPLTPSVQVQADAVRQILSGRAPPASPVDRTSS